MARFVDIESEAVTEVIGRRAFKSRKDIQEFLDDIPTADVVEVVRCEKCKRCEHFFPEKKIGEEARETYYCSLLNGNRGANDFCSYGIRKSQKEV